MQFDEVYSTVGDMGVFQIGSLIAACAMSLYDGEPSTMNFVGGSMDHFCRIDRLANLSYDQQLEIAIPWNTVRQKFEQCSMFDVDFSNYTDEQLVNWNRTRFLENYEGTAGVKSCSQWNYVQDTYTSTIVSRFNLVCDDRRHLTALASTLYMMGGLFGSFLAGILSDRFGRKPSIVAFLTLRCIGAAMFTFAPNYELFAVGRFILGIGGSGNRIVSYALAAEVIGPRYRTLCMGIIQVFLALGVVFCALIGFFIRDDYHYQLAYCSPYLLLLFLALTVVPESPRWLFAKGRYDQLNNLFRLIARVNRKKLPDGFDSRKILRKDAGAGTSRPSALTLFSPALRLRSGVVLFGWFAASLIYYSILLNAGSLPGDIFLNTGIIGAVGLPSLVVGMFLSRTRLLGRRITAALGLLGVGLFYFITIPILIYGLADGTTALSFMSQFSLTIYSVVLVVYTSELFPTEVRNLALGCALTCSRISSTIAPYMGSSLSEVWIPLPSLIIGLVATLSGILFFFLPETLGQPICDTVQEVENQRAERKKEQVAKTDGEHQNSASGGCDNNNNSNSNYVNNSDHANSTPSRSGVCGSNVVISVNGVEHAEENDGEKSNGHTNSNLPDRPNGTPKADLGSQLKRNLSGLFIRQASTRSTRSSLFAEQDPVDERVRRFSGLGHFNAGFLLDEFTNF